MRFEMRKPMKLLRPWIECYWNVELTTGTKVKKETILPNGKIEMIFALQGDYHVMNRSTKPMHQAWLSGIHHSPLEIQYSGSSNLVGIRFYPHGLFPFLNIPIHETVNQVEHLQSFWGQLQGEVYEALCTLEGSASMYTVLNQLLMKKITEQKTTQHQAVSHLVAQIKANPNQSIAELAMRTGFTQRHLNRVFKDQTGINPKLFGRITRFEQAFSLLHAKSEEDVSTIVSELGYYDQSHFNREFKRFSGMTPFEYRKRAIESNNFL
ncbi:DUF6597 domain-containing transcriptional factor [Thalassobacillus hwangdonensis]|uniref:DUF6597 domain-containing transcriptional factor n=1 Tax=Thalassobacillus hwangdonensis TaxID=546108 RepID=A0ABW3L4R6_9BACI